MADNDDIIDDEINVVNGNNVVLTPFSELNSLEFGPYNSHLDGKELEIPQVRILQNLCRKSNITFDILHRFWSTFVVSPKIYANSRILYSTFCIDFGASDHPLIAQSKIICTETSTTLTHSTSVYVRHRIWRVSMRTLC